MIKTPYARDPHSDLAYLAPVNEGHVRNRIKELTYRLEHERMTAEIRHDLELLRTTYHQQLARFT